MTKGRTIASVVALGVVALIAARCVSDRCLSAKFRYGVTIDTCPAGDVFSSVMIHADGLRRGQAGSITLNASMLYVLERETEVRDTPLSTYQASIELARDGKIIPVELSKDAQQALKNQNATRYFDYTLPKDLEDGDYTLTARIEGPAGKAKAIAQIPLYAPAKVHVVTDRPLYEPGNTIMFRAIVVRARDLVPLDNRPGRFKVTDADGVMVFDERHNAGAFGVAAAELPLDTSAREGQWRIIYESGDATDSVMVDVRPFTLPRFSVDVVPDKTSYGKGMAPKVDIKAKTAAGVPMAATVRLDWNVSGAWPPPPEWLEKFPKTITLPSSGSRSIILPPIPDDLVKKNSLTVTATAADDTGDEETGSAALVFAEDAIDVAVITELGQGSGAGLVEGTNNRVFLRATTADGAALPGAVLTVTRAWDPKDKGIDATADEDGVAVVQLDPGPAVNIVVPPLPVRLPKPPPEVQRQNVSEFVSKNASLADLQTFDTFTASIAPCSRYVSLNQGTARVTLQVSPSGSVDNAFGGDDAGACIASVLRSKRFNAGAPRIFAVDYVLRPPYATLGASHDGSRTLPKEIDEQLDRALLDARTCIGRTSKDSSLGRMVSWSLVSGRFTTRVYDDRGKIDALLDGGAVSCVLSRVQQAMRDRTLDSEKDSDGYGVVRVAVNGVTLPGQTRGPKATTRLGYELRVSARVADKTIGATKVFIEPGHIPAMRLRATPAIAAANDKVLIEFVRGPDFVGELPKKLTLLSETGYRDLQDVDVEKRRVTFSMPKDAEGWYHAQFAGGTARVFVPRTTNLKVAVAADKPVYKPGEMATVRVTTSSGDTATDAAVGLFGVDETLGLLAPLVPPSALDRLSPAPVMREPAFSVFDAVSLSLGRLRGANAQTATVLFVQSVPQPEALDVTTAGTGVTVFEPYLPLADRFYSVLAVLYAEVAAWEKSSKKEEKMTPKVLLSLWEKALVSAKQKGIVTTDVFGRPLRLQRLPDDLVAMADPRLVIRDGARLPEDVEAWIPFVRRTP